MRSLRTLTTAAALASNALCMAGNPTIIPDRELLITQRSVVESPRAIYPGAWSFGKLMEELVGPEEAPAAIRDWLLGFTVRQQVENQFILPRASVMEKVIIPWQKRDGFDPAAGSEWKPKLENAPFRLLAIVNRLDLAAPDVADRFGQIRERWQNKGSEARFVSLFRDATGVDLFEQERMQALFKNQPRISGYGFLTNTGTPPPSGEGRFVFQVTDPSGAPLPGGWTVIFEYALRELACGDRTRTWANVWHSLSHLDPTSPVFAAHLEEVTTLFTHRNQQRGGDPVLNQFRSNDAALAPVHEFRQWTISDKRFKPVLLAQTPVQESSLPITATRRVVERYLDGQEPLIESGIFILPAGFLAASAVIPPEKNNFTWDLGARVKGDVRRTVSLATCNGCHAGETACDRGFHIHPRAAGMPSLTSQFLRLDGEPLRVSDPARRGGTFTYSEMEDRANIMLAFLEPSDSQRERKLRDALHKRHVRAH